jgi:hypothetical protein
LGFASEANLALIIVSKAEGPLLHKAAIGPVFEELVELTLPTSLT